MNERQAEASRLQLLPAVDIAAGRVALHAQPSVEMKRLGDPIEAALRWQSAGAEWIHLVDLDAAYGRGHNRQLLTEIAQLVDIDVQVSGGIDDDESLRWATSTGCRRVNLSTRALDRPDWCAEVISTYGDRIALGLDVKGHTLAARGSAGEPSSSGEDLFETLALLDDAGCARYIVTDVDKDGMQSGPNLQLLSDVCNATTRPVVSSGGVAELSDLEALVDLVPRGLEGTILGTALHEEAFTLEDALRQTNQLL